MKTQFNKTNTTVYLEGTLTKYNFSKFLEKMQDLIKMRSCEIIIDCMHLKTIDSIGLGTIISLSESARKHGKNLYLIGLRNTPVASDTTAELKEHIASTLDISNKIANSATTDAPTLAPKTPALKRV